MVPMYIGFHRHLYWRELLYSEWSQDSGGGSESGGGSSGGSGTGGSGSGSGENESGDSGNAGGSGSEITLGYTAHSLTLNGDIGVNFYLELNDAIIKDSSAVMQMEVNYQFSEGF